MLSSQHEEEIEARLADYRMLHAPANYPFANPFTHLHARLSELLLAPLRRRLVDSVAVFVAEAFVIQEVSPPQMLTQCLPPCRHSMIIMCKTVACACALCVCTARVCCCR